jgi:hypothetical protein
MAHYKFDESNINWNQIEGFDHLSLFILDIDRDNKIVDVLLKFDANEKIALHRHVALNHMLVIQGEHILYEPTGDIKERRPTGHYTVSPASNDPHREGGGADQDVVILFSIRGTDGNFYEFLDDDMNVIASLGMDDTDALLAAQNSK